PRLLHTASSYPFSCSFYLSFLSFYSFLFFFSCYGAHRYLHSFPTRRSSDLVGVPLIAFGGAGEPSHFPPAIEAGANAVLAGGKRSEEHTSELQSRFDLVCRLLLEKKKKMKDK